MICVVEFVKELSVLAGSYSLNDMLGKCLGRYQ